MKLNIYKLVAAATIALTLQSGCKKDFLDKQPFNQVTGDVAFTTAEGAEKLMAGGAV